MSKYRVIKKENGRFYPERRVILHLWESLGPFPVHGYPTLVEAQYWVENHKRYMAERNKQPDVVWEDGE